jgi:hypothetical protein
VAPTATQTLQGSLLVDRATRGVAFTPGPSLQRSGVAGRVFLDENANGRFDPQERPLAGVVVRVGTGVTTSDSDGVFRAWDLVPFEPVLVTVDSASLASPLWVPERGGVSVVPGPNRFLQLDVPIVQGGVIEGRVLWPHDISPRGVAGVRLNLTNRRTGATRALVTFSDGDFSVISVAPGEYELSVDESDLSRLHARSSGALRLTVPPDADGARLTGVDIVVSPRP